MRSFAKDGRESRFQIVQIEKVFYFGPSGMSDSKVMMMKNFFLMFFQFFSILLFSLESLVSDLQTVWQENGDVSHGQSTGQHAEGKDVKEAKVDLNHTAQGFS